MPEYCYTIYTMKDVYGEDYQAFSLFGPMHIFWLALCACVCVVGAILYRRASEKGRRACRMVLGVVLLARECVRQLIVAVTGQWHPEILPLHLCSINIFVCLWYSIRPSKLAGNLLYALCLPGAAAALLSPTWLCMPMASYCHIDSEVMHILLLLYPVLLLAGGFRPDMHMLPKVLLCLVGACVAIYPLNAALGTNFMFINDPSDNVITMAFAAVLGERFYLIVFALVMIVLLVAMYMPWWVADRRKLRSER